MKVKRAPFVTKLRKDPKALREFFDFVRRRTTDGATTGQITVANKTYTLRTAPAVIKAAGA